MFTDSHTQDEVGGESIEDPELNRAVTITEVEGLANIVVGFVLGLATGLLTPVVQRFGLRVRGNFRARRALDVLGFDTDSIYFFTLNRWSIDRPLLRTHIRQSILTGDTVSNTQDWCDGVELAAIRSELTDEGGPACTLVDFEPDHGESAKGRNLQLVLGPSVYGDFIAVSEYFKRNPERVSLLMQRLHQEDTRAMVRSAPRSVLAINMTVTSADGKLLTIRRSGAVRTSQNVWTLGPNETMNLPNQRPGDSEDFFDLAERCLREECGLQPVVDYGNIVISWMGYNVPAALVHIVGHVRSTLDATEIDKRIAECHGIFETDSVSWIPDTKRSLRKLLEEHQSHGKKVWIDSAPLAAQEYWRVRPSVIHN